MSYLVFFLFFFNDTATTEIYTLSLHDALPILQLSVIDLALIESVWDVHRGNREVGRRELGVSANHLSCLRKRALALNTVNFRAPAQQAAENRATTWRQCMPAPLPR